MNVTVESLRAKHGDGAERAFAEIADLGGYGTSHGNYIGGLDVLGAIDPSNTVISETAKERISELSGVKRKDVDKKIASGTIIPPDQFQKQIDVPK